MKVNTPFFNVRYIDDFKVTHMTIVKSYIEVRYIQERFGISNVDFELVTP